MQKYGCMLKISSFGAILLAYDKIVQEGAQNEPNLPLWGGGLGGGPGVGSAQQCSAVLGRRK